MRLDEEIRDSEEYKRIFGSKEPKDADLSKGKLSVELCGLLPSRL